MITCVAIDDEPIALEIIKDHCNRRGDISLECFTSPADGLAHIHRTKPDLVFLDVEMNSHNGLELARELPEGTLLIFTTAFSQYALDGFDMNAIDFLHKPIFYERFARAMDKVAAWKAKEGAAPAYRDTLTVKSEYKNVVIDLDTIDYVEAMDNYVKIYRRGLPTIVSQITMREVESRLPAERFIRVHRSFIVALDGIDRFSNRKIYLRGITTPIPVGRTYNDSFQRLYDAFRLNGRE